MKKTTIFILTVIISLSTISCDKKYGDSHEAFILFKFNDVSYENYVAVLYSLEKDKIIGYPHPGEVSSMGLNNGAKKCSEGYYLNFWEGPSSPEYLQDCYTDITFSEYKEIWEETMGKDIRDTLTSRIVDKKPYKEMYTLPLDMHNNGYYDIDEINSLIESGKIFTYEGVKRIK